MTVSAADPDPTDPGPADGRDETPTERLDRNWAELLQELRVTQTGSQLLTGLLLTLPFQSRFASLTAGQVALYLVVLAATIVAALLALAPVSLHRLLFRRHEKDRLIAFAHTALRVVLLAVALSVAGTATLIFWIVVGASAAIVAAVATAALIVATWILVPLALRRRST